MLHRLFLPLTFTAFLVSPVLANAYSSPLSRSPQKSTQCESGESILWPTRQFQYDSMADAPIGGLSGALDRRMQFASGNLDLVAISNSGKNVRPYMVAALAGMGSPASGATATSCYPPLSFATASVPEATAGTGYSVTLVAKGGQPPYSWSFGQSSLPPGFSINSAGDVTGTPSVAGTYAFNVVVTDSLKTNVIGALTLTVTAPPPTQPPATQPPPTQPPPTQPPPTQPPPTQPPPTQPPTGPATGTALNACRDITSSGTYYLANDVSSPGTCFGIDANNITLNLNGHTITYGTGGGLTPTPAIEAHDPSWTLANSPNYTGNSYSGSVHGGFEAYGGTIVQSSNAAPFSDVFAFGEANYASAPYIHNITATFQNLGAQFYNSLYMPTGAKIENNTIYDNVTNIQHPGQGALSARSQFQGQVIFIAGQENNPVTSGDLISGNKIIGGPQGGIRSVDQYSTITNNDIAVNSFYSNDWCVEISADHSTASGNNCHPTSGRGINIDANYVTVENNTINVTELKQNAEYSGCELGGAYGIRVEYMTLGSSQPGAHTNDTISGNTITVAANDCNALGFDLIYLPASASNINVTGNTVVTTNAGKPNVVDAGFQFDDAWGNGINITGNTITSTDEWMYGWWDGYNGITVGHNTWKGSPPVTFLAQDGGCSPSYNEAGAACPVSINITDNLPNNVSCGANSIATVTIAGQVTQCKPR